MLTLLKIFIIDKMFWHFDFDQKVPAYLLSLVKFALYTQLIFIVCYQIYLL